MTEVHSGTARSPSGETRRPRSAPTRSSTRNLAPVFWGLAILFVAVAGIGLPKVGFWPAVRVFVLEATAIILAVFVVSQGEWTRARVRAALLSGPNPFIL